MNEGRLTLWNLRPESFARVTEFEAIVGYTFRNKSWIYEALTHRSALVIVGISTETLSDERPWNERLEFLGDSVLNLVVSEFLSTQSRSLSEGDMSRMRAALVCESSLAKVARERLNLGDYIVLGPSEVRSLGHQKESILADALEAVIGAIYSDAGFDQAKRFVLSMLVDTWSVAKAEKLTSLLERDHKTILQELTQAKLRATPTYDVLDESGPAHSRLFEVAVYVNVNGVREEWGRGLGTTKKRAAQHAAKSGIEKMKEALQ
ncbi:MAG: ribonuclease III [Proteobacteria bacterium]|nr:ribonuclease III [Pseudomonadota bacterium]